MRAIVLGVAVLVAGGGTAGAGSDGLVLRANGWYRGTETISPGRISCEIPTVGNAIADGAFSVPLFGIDEFPDRYQFAVVDEELSPVNPCGGYIQVQNNMTSQGLVLEKVRVRLRIAGAQTVRGVVPLQKKWLAACPDLRRYTVFTGLRLQPIDADDTSGSGAENVGFLQVFPMLNQNAVQCLQQQLATATGSGIYAVTVVIRAVAFGRSDAGSSYRSNSVSYTLNLSL